PEGVLRALAPLRPTLGRGGYDEEWRTRHLASRAWRALGQLDSAVVEGRRALETVERVRRSYGSGLLRSSFAAGKRAVYADLVETLVGQGRLAESLAVSDAARARALDEAVVEDEGSWVEESGELLLREIDRVLESAEAIESGEMSWDPGVDSLALGELYVRLAELRSRYETTVRSSGDEGRALDLEAVRRALGPNEVAVEYFVPEDGVVRVFLVTRSGVDVLDTDLTAHNLRSRVRLARALLADRATRVDDMRSVLAGMFESLLRPVLETHRVPDGADLLVVPHDVISYVPPTLWLDEERGMTVGERYRVRILPALALITTQPDARSGFGEATAFAPLTGELPATRDEAMAVGRATGATLLVDGDATEGAFRQALERSDLVHVATHGVLNTHHPLFSRIVFADGAGGSSRDDGRLEVHELLDLQAGAGLVFLSGCETGVGRAASSRYGPGEDYLTLGQAFLRAGAGAVVATLWRVDDEASATFAAHFYEALRTRSAADALRHAQRAMRQDPRYEAPYFWAGYQLLGASGPVSAEGWAGSPSEPERRVADNLP
ncbi:MAG: CHAT domain-containing protein, partial [Longimicrobiales bacterium]|nr:CHAT domain-containing protein [Longimicrobiales bacterium]